MVNFLTSDRLNKTYDNSIAKEGHEAELYIGLTDVICLPYFLPYKLQSVTEF